MRVQADIVVAEEGFPVGTIGGQYTVAVDNNLEVAVDPVTKQAVFEDVPPGDHVMFARRYSTAGALLKEVGTPFTIDAPTTVNVEVPSRVIVQLL